MNLKKVALISLLLSTSLFASSGATETDILQRSVNFLIFVALAYYLLADKVKGFFVARTASIAKSYEEIENKIKEAKASLEEAKAKREEALRLASELVDAAKKDAVLQSKRVLELADEECARIQKNAAEEKAMIKKKMVMESIEEALSDIFERDGFGVADSEFAKIIAKKVAQ